jgi:hypothetical protein
MHGLSTPFLQPSSAFMAPVPATRVATHQYLFAFTGLTSSFLFRSTNFDTKGTESCLPSCALRGCGIPGHESVSHGIPSIHKHQVTGYIFDTALSALDSLLVMRSSENSKMKQQFPSFYKTLNCIFESVVARAFKSIPFVFYILRRKFEI